MWTCPWVDSLQVPQYSFRSMNLSRLYLARTSGFAALFLLAFTTLAPAPARAAEGVSLRTPRATVRSFIDAMRDVKAGKPARIKDAVKCLDLSQISIEKATTGETIANKLKGFLDRKVRIQYDLIRADVKEDFYALETIWPKLKGITLTRTEDGSWLFSSQTVADIPAMFEKVEDWPILGKIKGGGTVETFADWLRARVPESLRGKTLVMESWQWIALVVLAVAGVMVERFVMLLMGFWIRRWLRKKRAETEENLQTNAPRPIGLVFMAVLWWAVVPLLDLPVGAQAALLFASKLVIVFASVWAAYRLVDLVTGYFMALAERTESKFDDVLVPMIRRALKIVVVAVGLIFVADNLNIKVTSLLAGLGLGGLAFALAAKDTVENLFGSITVLADKPFEIGDWVVIGDKEGTVEQVGFRSTRIRTFYNSQITVPNATLVNATVDNMGRRRFRRVKCMIGIEYGTPADKIDAFCEGIRELIRLHPYTRKDYYMVYFNEFAGSSLNILLYAFHEVPDWATELRERHRLFTDIVRLAGRIGVEFAFPTQTVHVASMPEARAEAPGKTRAVPQPDPGSESGAADTGEAVRLGRAEADAIVNELWGQTPQRPVTMDAPDLMGPGRAGDGSE